MLFWAVDAACWPYFVPYDPYAVDPLNALQSPSSAHRLGTDDLGRDVLSRVLAGATSVLVVAPTATILALFVGTVAGLTTGFYRGRFDEVAMRILDAVISVPLIVTAVVVLGLLGPSTLNVIFLIGMLFSPFVTRTVRAAVIAERERPYVEAARMRGERGLYIMGVELLPNVRGPILVEGTIRFGFAVFIAATLSFLGLGLQQPSPDWGLTIALERLYIQVAPWTVLFPALALASLIIGMSLITDSVRRVLDA